MFVRRLVFGWNDSRRHRPSALGGLLLLVSSPVLAAAAPYQIFVSNEKSGDVTVIDGNGLKVSATIPVGKRPRGIHVDAAGKTVYVAVSGTPVREPPPLDAKGNPIFKEKKKADDDDDDDDVKADKAADGIAVVDVASRQLTQKLPAGSDPEEFALSADGKHIYISNEDVKTASVMNIATAKVEHIIPVGQEPEGVSTAPDGGSFYVTCEAGGDIYIIETAKYAVAAHFKVQGRPRSVDFLPGAAIGFIPSESAGQLNVIDTAHPAVLKTIVLPAGSRPMKARVGPGGSKLYVSNGRAGTISVFDTHSYELLDTIKVGARPWGIGFSPDGKFLFAANGPSNDVSVVDLATDKEVTRIPVGERPWGIAVVPAAP